MSGSPFALPREMVLASAGSGKTYYLSSRLIGLLARGVPPEAIWASTFTRKAAAEILERVLLRLAKGALDEEAAMELARSAWLDPSRDPPPGFLTPDRCGELLADLVFSLHRAHIGTLDSFFVQVAAAFARELRLPPAWRLVEGPEEEEIRSEALEAVLERGDAPAMAELVRLTAKGEAGRGVHRLLFGKVDELLSVQREVDPAVGAEAWRPGFALKGPRPEEEERRLEELADAVGRAPVPENKKGTLNRRWQEELARLPDVLRSADWKGFFEKGLGKKMLGEDQLVPAAEAVYDRRRPDAALAAVLDEAADLLRREAARDFTGRASALQRLATRYRQAFEESQAVHGGYRFGDLTHLLRESSLLGSADTLFFRLDARIQHLLLDEFQDTSLEQWEALDPIVSELLAGGEAERAAVLVADPKQSIYGWRGARPGLVHWVGSRYGLRRESLGRSFRAGPVLLDVVQEVFTGLEDNPVIEEMEGVGPAIREWLRDFYDQEAHDPGQPGYVELRTGPPLDGGKTIQPGFLDAAAEFIARLHMAQPHASVGVLVRKNNVVTYLIAALRRLGVPVSGEGGTALTDAAPVNAVLALLRLADHPGDTLARYHVAKTPLGEVVGYGNHEDEAEAGRLARRIRGRLLADGYGPTLDEWAREIGPSCDAREQARLEQLVELGFRWDAKRTLRPSDFVRLVKVQRVEDPTGARVRVMTVHQAKGLEFDVVVLPHLYESLEGRGDAAPVEPLRDPATGRVRRVYPGSDKIARVLLPELREAHAQVRAAGLRDELSTLYVAMTRPRYALHMLVPADGERGEGHAKSPARILRHALAPGVPAASGVVLFHRGDPEWHRTVWPQPPEEVARVEAVEVEVAEVEVAGGAGVQPAEGAGVQSAEGPSVQPAEGAPVQPAEGAGVQPEVAERPEFEADVAEAAEVQAGPAAPHPLLRPVRGARRRNLPRRSPSSLEGGETVDLAAHLRLDFTGEARLHGTVVHAWCEAIEWLDEGPPGEEALLAIARRVAPGLSPSRAGEWLAEFHTWLGAAEVRQALSRNRYPAGARVERELPFLHRQAGGILHGYIDRLVLVEREGRVVGAEVLDFKTDLLDGADEEAVAAKVAFYRPQLDAYRAAVAGRYRLRPEAVKGALLFLRPGLLREV